MDNATPHKGGRIQELTQGEAKSREWVMGFLTWSDWPPAQGIGHYPPPITYYLLPITYYLLPILDRTSSL
jgi:hypothetical protein